MPGRKMDGRGRIGAEDSTVMFMPPEGVKLEGEAGRAMVDWKLSPDGSVHIVAFDGVSLGGEEEAEVVKETAEDGMDEYAAEEEMGSA